MSRKRTRNKDLRRTSTIAGTADPLFLATGAVALVAATILAYQLRWLCDDIFITFRYADQWLQGHGVVYNPGERVEGYTHALWLLLIVLSRLVGFEYATTTMVLGILASAATLFLIGWISWRLTPRPARFVPLALLLLAINVDFRIWATSGLETSSFTFLVFAGYAALLWDVGRRRFLEPLAGLLMTLAVLMRPDGAVFLTVAGAFVAVRSLLLDPTWSERIRRIARFALPFVVVYGPYLMWKFSYYGDIVPNTYYAKSGMLAYFEQGWRYIGMYLQAHIGSVAVLLVLPAIWIKWRHAPAPEIGRWRSFVSDPQSSAVVLGMAMIAAYVVGFVAKVGGDFMYARFLHPVMPLAALAIELSIVVLAANRPSVIRLVMIAFVVLGFYENSRRSDIFVDDQGRRRDSFINGITDEHWYWTQTEQFGIDPIAMNEYLGKTLAAYFQGERVSVLLRGQASLGFYGRFADCVENAGLTDSTIARQSIVQRGRPGHEKNAPVEYLERRKVQFLFMRSPIDTSFYRQISFDVGGQTIRAEMFFYDGPMLSRLKSRLGAKVQFVDFAGMLDEYLRRIDSVDPSELKRDYDRFRRFYFAHTNDHDRESAFTKRLSSVIGG